MRWGGRHWLLAVAAACAPGCCSGAGGNVSSGRVEAAAGQPPDAAEADDFVAEDRADLGEIRYLGGRKYMLGVPMDYETVLGDRSLLVLLHGFDEKPQTIYPKFSHLRGIVDAPFLVAPEGYSEYGMPPSWNTESSQHTSGPEGQLCTSKQALGCASKSCSHKRSCHHCFFWWKCSPRCVWATCVDDHAFLHKLLDTMEANYKIDRKRIFLAGFSMGGLMAWDILGRHEQLSKRFTAMAVLHGSPQAGYATSAPDPVNFPWLLGIWGGMTKDYQDGKMPPISNIYEDPGRSMTTEIPGGTWYYHTAENATKTYVKGLRCPSSGLTLDTILQPLRLKDKFNCIDDGCNGAVVRCTWNTYVHQVPFNAYALVWRYFVLAANARFGPAPCPYPHCAEPWQLGD